MFGRSVSRAAAAEHRISAEDSLNESRFRRLLKHFVLVLILIVYSLVGAGIFYSLEAPEQKLRAEIRQTNLEAAKYELINKILATVGDSEKCFENGRNCTEDLKFLITEFQIPLRKEECSSSSSYEWDYWNALLYAFTVCTTIGYGHLTCRTRAGQVLTMIYALFGIPLVLTVLNDLGKVLYKYSRKLWSFFHRRILATFRPKQWQRQLNRLTSMSQLTADVTPEFHLPLPVAILVLVLYLFACAAIFKLWEREWDYFTAFECLGDIFPEHPRYMIIGFGLIILGLALVSMCINVIHVRVQEAYIHAANRFDFNWLNVDENDEEKQFPNTKRNSDGFPGISSIDHQENKSTKEPLKKPESVVAKGLKSIWGPTLGIFQMSYDMPIMVSRPAHSVETQTNFIQNNFVVNRMNADEQRGFYRIPGGNSFSSLDEQSPLVDNS